MKSYVRIYSAVISKIELFIFGLKRSCTENEKLFTIGMLDKMLKAKRICWTHVPRTYLLCVTLRIIPPQTCHISDALVDWNRTKLQNLYQRNRIVDKYFTIHETQNVGTTNTDNVKVYS